MPPKKAASRRGWGKLRTIGSGRIQASYVSPIDGLRHNAPHTYDNRMDAEAWLADEKRLIDHGTWTPPAERVKAKAANAIRVEEYTKKWLTERDLSAGTRELYTTHARKRIYPVLGDAAVSEMTPAVDRAWWAGMGTKYPTARRHAYSVLRAVNSVAMEGDTGRVDETRLVHAAADDTLVVSDYPPTGMAELAWSRQTDGTINADN